MLRTIFLTAYGAVALLAFLSLLYLWGKYYTGEWIMTLLVAVIASRISYVVGAASTGFWFKEK